MAKEIMTTAKELAFKAFCLNVDFEKKSFLFHRTLKSKESQEIDVRERFENWWSDNYGNRDSTKFVPEHNVFVENRRYIQAE
jgi:hypothetical protein